MDTRTDCSSGAGRRIKSTRSICPACLDPIEAAVFREVVAKYARDDGEKVD